MNTNFIFSTIVVVLLTFIAGCKKGDNSSGAGSQQQLIANAKQFFIKEVAPATLQNEKGIGSRTPKIPVWAEARTINISTGPAVLVPLQYANKVTVSTSFSGGRPFSLEAMTRLLIYKGKNNRTYAFVVTALPDDGNKAEKNKFFSGMIVVEDWAGNTVKDYKFSGGKIYTRVKETGTAAKTAGKQVEGHKAVTDIIIETCYTFTTCIGTADNPYESCNTEDLGCTYVGVDEDLTDDGGGGGGDAGGIVNYVDPNTFTGVPTKTTPELTVSGTNLKATTTYTGLFVLANVNLSFDFDPRAQTVIANSEKTFTTGWLGGTWAQTGVKGEFTSNGEINFILTATVTSSIVPGIPYTTGYDIYVQYNVNTNTCYISSVKTR